MKSMTGFGKGLFSNEKYQIEIELKSVNHRFLDMQIRMPKEYQQFEMMIRQALKSQLGRGRIECAVFLKHDGADTKELVINWQLLDSLLEQLNEAQRTRYQGLNFNAETVASGLVNHADFFQIVEKQEQSDKLELYLMEALQQAIVQLNASREEEGTGIRQVMTAYLGDFTAELAQVSAQAEFFEADYQEKLLKKMTEIVGESVDKDRLLTEVALLIERGDIHEELDRLVIHSKKMTTLLAKKASVGREMDFLIQEMNREVNTIGSKSAPIAIKEAVVQMKTILEKIREQVQNIE